LQYNNQIMNLVRPPDYVNVLAEWKPLNAFPWPQTNRLKCSEPTNKTDENAVTKIQATGASVSQMLYDT
jgi:hypothetical protein